MSVSVIRPEGNLLSEPASEAVFAEFEQKLEANPDRMVLDLSQVEHLNSLALGYLIRMHSRMEDRGLELVLCGLSVSVRRLLTITKLDKVFTQVEDCASLDVQ